MNKPETLVQTVESKIEDKSFYPVLDYIGNYYAYLERKLYNTWWHNKDIITNDFENDLKSDYIEKYKIPGRFFNSLSYAVKGYIKLDKENLDLKINNYKVKIKDLKSDIKKIRNKLKSFMSDYKKERLHNAIIRKQCKIDRLTNLIKTVKPKKRVFGSKHFYKSQFSNKEYKNDHKSWHDTWKMSRDYHFDLIGSKDESNGNQLCQYYHNTNGEFLSIRLPDIMSDYKKYIELPIKFSSDKPNKKYYNYFKAIVPNLSDKKKRQALSYRFTKKANGFWYVACTFSLTQVIEPTILGCNGIDINYGLIANTTVDYCGNFLRMQNYHCDPEKLSSEQMYDLISLQLDEIVFDSKKNGYCITVENLDLSEKKLSYYNKITNRKIHMIAYAKILELLTSKCFKNQVELVTINPAYTSIIGKFKYRKMYGISVHNAAAMVIARRGLSINDTIGANRACVLQSGEIKNTNSKSSWNYVCRHKHSWSHWSYLDKNLEKCSASLKKIINADPLILNEDKIRFDNLEDLLSSRFNPTHFSFVSRFCA
jgi:IS605 OrfB family transposase